MARIKRVLIGLMAVGMLMFTGEKLTLHAQTEEPIEQGVVILGIDVGGMTGEQAKSVLSTYMTNLKNTPITLNGAANRSVQILASDLGVHLDTDILVEEAWKLGKEGNLIVRFKQKEDIKKEKYEISRIPQIDEARIQEVLQQNQAELETTPVDATMVRQNGKFLITDSQIGENIDIGRAVPMIADYVQKDWKESDNVITLPITEVKPRATHEELAQVKDLLGTFTTAFSSGNDGRSLNIETGCSKLNGQLIFPGDELSADQTMMPYDEEHGYGLGGAYENGVVVQSIGGGICQVSTTLYNALIRAELEIIKRYNHSMTVSYVDLSADAAIATPYKDLQFRNNLDFPVYIEGYCYQGKITFNIYGKETRPSNRSIRFVSETTETNEPPVTFQFTNEQGIGYYHVGSARTGYKAKLWKVITIDGKETSREVFNTSSYNNTPRTITVGTGGADETQVAELRKAVNSGNPDQVVLAIETVKTQIAEAEAAAAEAEAAAAAAQQPTDQEPTDQEPTDQGATDPQPTDPQPTDPQPTEPQPTDPQQTEGQPAEQP